MARTALEEKRDLAKKKKKEKKKRKELRKSGKNDLDFRRVTSRRYVNFFSFSDDAEEITTHRLSLRRLEV